jgi:hypothetical protein
LLHRRISRTSLWTSKYVFENEDTDVPLMTKYVKQIGSLLSGQSMSRLIGPGCRKFAIPHAEIAFGVQKGLALIPGRTGGHCDGFTATDFR